MSGLTDRLRQVAGQAMPAFAYGEPTFENYTESYAEQLAEFQLLFRPTTVLAMLDVIDAAEQVDAWVGTDGEWDAYLTLHKRLHRFREVAS